MVMMIHIDSIERDQDNDLVIRFRLLDLRLQEPVGDSLISSPVQSVELVQDAKGIATDGSRTAVLIHTQSGSRYLSTIALDEVERLRR
jgi:hypothetical protein